METTSLTITHTIPYEEAEQTMIEIESLAKKVYKSSNVLSSDLLFRWYQCNPFMWWFARENNRLIGYMSAIPLKHEAFLKTLQSDFDEFTNITDDDLRIWNDQVDKNYSIYICSMVINPDYQKRPDLPLYRLIAKHFLESLLFYGKNGSIVTEWSAVAVSEAGCHILQHYFELTCLSRDNHNNSIWYGKTSIEHQEQLLKRILRKLQS
jgi:hypothetical protein